MGCSNLSGWHVPSQPGNRCRCGREASADELLALVAQRLSFEYAEARQRVRLGLVA